MGAGSLPFRFNEIYGCGIRGRKMQKLPVFFVSFGDKNIQILQKGFCLFKIINSKSNREIA